MTLAVARRFVTAAGLLFGFCALSAVPFLLGWTEIPAADRGALTVCVIGALLGSVGLLVARGAPLRLVEWLLPTLAVFGFGLAIVLLSAAIVFIGPRFYGVAPYFVEVPLMAFLMLRRPWAWGTAAASMVGLGVALMVLDGEIAPVQLYLNIVAAAVVTGVLVGGIAAHIDDARRAERAAKTALRRFVAPEVADVVVSSGAEDMLAPHQCEVGVIFVDLRGFTEFTNNVSPGRIVEVLGEYYAAVGEVLQENGATIGGFDGDGVMAFVGDPVPHDKPAHDTVRTAEKIAHRLDWLVEEWSEGGHPLGYGIGVTFGLATLGVVGFEGRSDYTAVGAVVNLAARLCANAAPGEIVIAEAIREAAGVDDVSPRQVAQLKGFGATQTWALTRV
jgi:class 3 adenylate cyclase